MQTSYTVGPRTFVLDRDKAEAALAASVACIGLQSGGFSARDLMRAGCIAALAGIADLPAWMAQPRLKTGT